MAKNLKLKDLLFINKVSREEFQNSNQLLKKVSDFLKETGKPENAPVNCEDTEGSEKLIELELMIPTRSFESDESSSESDGSLENLKLPDSNAKLCKRPRIEELPDKNSDD
ncbi:hypothetical protein Ciccas_003892 [Cichlidogyrus casuarinus]|uniref:Uncharacterized protein n=1 Tax=Cichlidogyrus casuarinus TaxID=1844966 RepID=A0ABD2QDJ0_9PLAT